jgi:D-alanyl-D-alanine carboxypeptidase
MNTSALAESFEFVDSWLEFRRRRLQLPGLMVAVAHKGKILFNKAYGYANLQTREKLAPNHLFYIASQSKTFTATAVMQLAEKRKLHIDDGIVNFLPWLKIHKDKRFLQITIRQLMSHSAGIIRDGLDCDFWLLEQPFPSQTQFKRMVMESKLVIEPNTRMNYSNFGYGLLGMIVEAVSETPYARYVQENIIHRLGLNNVGPEFTPAIKNKLATGYSLLDDNGKRKPIVKNLYTCALAPAAGFYANIQDMCKYYGAHFIGTRSLLSDSSKREMQRCNWVRTAANPRREYGLGFNIEYAGTKMLFGHGGAMPGHSSQTLCDPAQELVVSLFINSIAFDTRSAVLGIYSVLNYFQANCLNAGSPRSHKRFAGRYADLWGVFEVVVCGKKIVAIDPDQWCPFNQVEVLVPVNNKTLKCIEAPGASNVGYLIQYNFSKKGTVKSVVSDGQTRLPEHEYQRLLARKTKIGR